MGKQQVHGFFYKSGEGLWKILKHLKQIPVLGKKNSSICLQLESKSPKANRNDCLPT